MKGVNMQQLTPNVFTETEIRGCDPSIVLTKEGAVFIDTAQWITNLEQMIAFAERLSAGIPHVRVDFYEVNGRLYFGEWTFFHWSGFKPFVPEEWDYTFGSWIKLPEKNGEDAR